MRLPLAWLSEFIELPGDDTLTERLEMAGFEDVFVEASGPDLSSIVVGRVEDRAAHPDADRLSVCRVDVGDGSARTIVCGAPNVAAGQKVAVALPGVRLPNGTKIKKSKLRGVVSQGMICSERELHRGDAHEGIWVLPEDARVGAPLSEIAGAAERVLDVSITPNRGDTASLLGLAREVRAIFGGELRLPITTPPEKGAPARDAVAVRIDAPEGCFHYVGRVVRGVRVGQSSEALRARLEASGIRSVNNVVDITNQVMLEFGQPLHAFDLAALAGGEIRVRRAGGGENLDTLDGHSRKLDSADLVIADAERAVAIAGVMGGASSEVSGATTDVLIESASFDPVTVRLSARRHGLHSEASYRFERGVDREGVRRAADRAATLLAELAGGQVAPGVVEARGVAPPRAARIELQVVRANRLLGLDLDQESVVSLLSRVGIDARPTREGVLDCAVPSHRNDLHAHQDLTEEVARIHGYERIPTTMPVAELTPARIPESFAIADRVRDLLAAGGLMEVASFPFVAEDDLDALRLPEDDPRRRACRLRNPIQDRERLLRTTLAPSLLRLARQNLARQVPDIALFEVARAFLPASPPPRGGGAAALPQEPLCAAGLLSETAHRDLWSGPRPPAPFFAAKGIVEKALSGLGYMASLRSGESLPYLHPGASVEVRVGGIAIGCVGELHPAVAAEFEIDARCAMFELNLSALLTVKKREFQFREVSREPSVRRDLAVLVDETQPAGALQKAIRKVGGEDLVSVEIFDRYVGRGVPEGRVSLAFRLVFQRADRSLTDAEVSGTVDAMVRELKERFGAGLR